MAKSGYTSVAVTDYDTLKFSWSIDSQSVINNSSVVDWKLELISGAYGAIDSTVAKGWAVEIDGQEFSGNNYINIGNNATKTLASGSITMAHNADGTKTFSYVFSQTFGITFNGTSISAKAGTGTGTLDTIVRKATINSAPSITDEATSATITYSNPMGAAVSACVSIFGDDDIAYRDISPTGTSYTFTFTDADREKFREALVNRTSTSIAFYVRSVVDGVYEYSRIYKTLTLVNATPTIVADAQDTNTDTVALTNDANVFIKGHNDVVVGVTGTALKGGYIVSEKITCGSFVEESSYANFTNVESGTIVITVTDSRGLTATKTLEKTVIPYIPLTCNLDVGLPNAEGEVSFTISGNYYKGSFGAKGQSNTLNLYYQYFSEDESSGTWTAVTVNPTDNKYSATVNLTGLDYTKGYTFQAYAEDKVGSIESEEKKVKSVPIFDWGANDFSFNVPVTIQGSNILTYDILFDSADGVTSTASTITLSKSVADYTYIEIFYTDNNGRAAESTRIFNPDGKRISLTCTETYANGSNTQVSIRIAVWDVSGNTLTHYYSGWAGFTYTSQNTTVVDGVKIYRIIGIK